MNQDSEPGDLADCAGPYQSSPGIVAATGGQTAAACVHDGAAEQEADDAA